MDGFRGLSFSESLCLVIEKLQSHGREMVHATHVFWLFLCHRVYNLCYLLCAEFLQVELIGVVVAIGSHCHALVEFEEEVVIGIVDATVGGKVMTLSFFYGDVFFLFCVQITDDVVNCRGTLGQHFSFSSGRLLFSASSMSALMAALSMSSTLALGI